MTQQQDNDSTAGGRSPLRRFWPALVAVAVIAVVVGTVLLVRSDDVASPAAPRPSAGNSTTSEAPPPVGTSEAAATPATCPAELAPDGPPIHGRWVPTKPTRDFDTLVPDEIPTHALTCRYRFGTPSGEPGKSGPVASVLTGDLTTMVGEIRSWPTDLDGAGGVCPAAGQSMTDTVLYGLTYADGSTVWISADTNLCSKLGNGRDTADVNRAHQLISSSRAGRWLTIEEIFESCPQDYNCASYNQGRWGQQLEMVPAGATEVEVGRATWRDQLNPTLRTVPADPALVAGFNDLPVDGPSQGSCTPDGEPANEDHLYTVRFSYADGPTVLIRVSPHCTPAVDNGSLAAGSPDDLGTIVPMLDQIIDG
ncbi:hypothetical protein GIS00_20020 [Nakamurella sp. YIM 132087]|uniref:Uncharacterized protein n=1 Tax=Nakamurella alba TaxID=2665158 RepID=A0A7K1FS80_9ACTN|nr:hypothetical protein [Nakamurella alba]MTD16229.1 hypothetical protein [Nakamurella alba]